MTFRPRIRAVLFAAMLAGFAAPLVVGALFPGPVREAVAEATAAVAELGPAGWSVIVLTQAVVATVGVLPASLIGIAAGALYGPGLGFALAALGTLAGAAASFAIGRSWLRPLLAAQIPSGARLAEIDRMIAADGWKAVCLIRLSPILPFAPTSVALSLTGVGATAYGLGTLAALPSLFACVLAGAAGRTGIGAWTEGAWLPPVLLAIGAAATLALMMKLRSALGRDPTHPVLER